MDAIPDINTSSAAVVVDDVTFRGPLLGLFGRPVWRVHWRRADDPAVRGISLLRPGQTGGAAELAGHAFEFVVRWRPDLRRRIGSRRSDPCPHGAFVTPAAVLQLAEHEAPAPGGAPASRRAYR